MTALPPVRAAQAATVFLIAAATGLLILANASYAACPGECSIPGRGSRSSDCYVEYNGPTFNFPAPPKPPKRFRCSDGDPSCDQDGETNDSCRLRIATCLNNADSRIPACAPTDVATYEVRNRPVGDPRHNAQLAAIDAEVSALLPTSDAVCSAARTIDVPVRITGSGQKKRGRVSFRSRATDALGNLDSDSVKFECVPGIPKPTVPPGCARAKVVSSGADLIGGPLARGRYGDYLIENDKIRLIVQKPDRVWFGIGTYGGNIIDADIQRPGQPGRDNFEEWIPGINVESTAAYSDATILNDGADCNPAVVRFTGVDELFDWVNGSSAVRSLGFTFPASADDVDIPVTVETVYTLATGDSYVQVETTITNTGAAPLGIYFVDYINGSGEVEMWRPAYGFGEPLATTSCPPATYQACTSQGTCDVCNVVAFAGEGTAFGLSYGYIQTENGSTAVSVSGVTVPLLGQEVAAVFLGAAVPNFNMQPAGVAGDAVTVTRYFAVGDGSIAAIVDARNEIQGITTGTISGQVTSGGSPVEDADVAVLGAAYPAGPAENVVSHFRTDSNGEYGGTLAPGSYEVRVNKDGRLQGSPDPANVTIVASLTTTQNFTLPAAGLISVTVTDENGDPVPAKVQLVGFDPYPDIANEQDVLGAIQNTTGVFSAREDLTPFGIAQVFFADRTGATGVQALEPGSYQVSVSHGMRYSHFTQNITVTSGAQTHVAAQIAKVVDTPGFITADFHVHSINSADSDITQRERVATHLAEGIDFFTPSDHEFRSDFGPVIDDMGVGDLISVSPGCEMTTFDYGHFNAWPLSVDPSKLNGGEVDWGRPGNGGIGTDYPSLGSYSMTPAELIDAAHADTAGNVVQINHFYSYMDASGLDIDTAEGGTGPPQSHTPGAERRLDPSIPNYFADNMDALEVWIESNRGAAYANFLGQNAGDWFNMINQGITPTGVADSDTHNYRTTEVGARTLVASAVTAPAALGSRALDLAANVKAGLAYGTDAPFLQVSATSSIDSAGLGAGDSNQLSTNDGTVVIDVTVKSAAWAEFDAIEFYVNNAPQPYDHDADAGTRDRYRIIPNVVHSAGVEFAVTSVNPFPSIPGATRFEASTQLVLNGLTEDQWVIVMVKGTDGVSKPLFPVIPNSLDSGSNTTLANLTDGNLGEGGLLALAYSNPIYIDADNNGAWTPPGVMLTP